MVIFMTVSLNDLEQAAHLNPSEDPSDLLHGEEHRTWI